MAKKMLKVLMSLVVGMSLFTSVYAEDVKTPNISLENTEGLSEAALQKILNNAQSENDVIDEEINEGVSVDDDVDIIEKQIASDNKVASEDVSTVIEDVSTKLHEHISTLLGIDSSTSVAYDISAIDKSGNEVNDLGKDVDVSINVDDISQEENVFIYHVLDTKDAIQKAYESDKLCVVETTRDDKLLLDEINALEDFLTDTPITNDDESYVAGSRNHIAYMVMTQDDDNVTVKDDTVLFTTDSFSTFAISWNNIAYNWRSGGQWIGNLSSVGNVSIKKNIAISGYYHFQLGGNMSSKTKSLVNGAIDGGNYNWGDETTAVYGDWTWSNFNNNGFLSSYFYNVNGYGNDVNISIGDVSCTYRNISQYNGDWVDVRLSVVSFQRNAQECVGNRPPLVGFGKNDITVNVLGCNYVEIVYEFFYAGTTTPITVKGNTSYTDIDYLQGIIIHDKCDGIYLSTSGSNALLGTVYANTVNGVPYIYDNGDVTTNGSVYSGDQSKCAAFTEIFSGTSIRRTYTFERKAERWGRGGITNEAEVVTGQTSILKVSKAVTGNYAPTDTSFTFNVMIKDNNGVNQTGKFGDITVNNGSGSFSLKGGQTVNIEELYPGYVITVTETTNSNYSSTVNNSTNLTYTYTAPANAAITTAVYTNEFIPYYLTINKTVKGSMGDKKKAFTFKVQLPSSYANKMVSTSAGTLTADNNAVITTTLSHGGSVTINGLSKSDAEWIKQQTNYSVSENDYSNEGYSTSYETSSSGTTMTVSVVNTNNPSVPTAVKSNNVTGGMAVIAGILMILIIVSLKRKGITE